MLPGLPKKGEDQVGPGIYSYKRNLRTFTASFKEQLILIDEKIGEKKIRKPNRQTVGWMDGGRRSRREDLVLVLVLLKHVIVCTYF